MVVIGLKVVKVVGYNLCYIGDLSINYFDIGRKIEFWKNIQPTSLHLTNAIHLN